MNNPAIRIESVSKYYRLYRSPRDRLKEAFHPFGKKYHREFYALRDISLKVGKGEILGIVGKNGSGKSTLLKLIAGVLTPNEGSIVVRGKISALLELGSGFNPSFTGIQNIFFYGTIMGFSRKEMEQRLDAIVDFADIGQFIHQPLKTYSSGMKSRLGFAVAVHIDPEILILDEVLSVGDALFQRKCYAKMNEFFQGNKTILYVSHNGDSVNRLCTRAILLDAGEILLDGDAKNVTTQYQKLLFSKSNGKRALQLAARSSKRNVAGRGRREYVPHPSKYVPDMIPKSTVEYRNEDVDISNARIVDMKGRVVNLLDFDREYDFCVDIKSGVDAEKVAFGFELKDVKGVRVATIESIKMYKMGNFYSIRKGSMFQLRYRFKCTLTTGMYYLNCGVSSFESEQKVLNRIIDVLAFKTINNEGYSGGYVNLVSEVEISTGTSSDIMRTMRE